MAALSCEVKIPVVEGLEAEQMTVGRHAILSCNSDSPLINAGAYELRSEVNAPVTYKVFKINKTSESNIEIEMTFYKTGNIQLSDFSVFDGNESHSISGNALNVISVIKPSEDGKPPKPFDPIFPLTMSIPSVYFAYVLMALAVVALYFVLKLRRLSYYRKLKDNLKQYQSPTEPEVQFYRSIRAAEKQGYPIENLDNAFRLYNLRSYHLPIFELSTDKLNKYFKHNFPQHKEVRVQLIRILADIEELKKLQGQSLVNQKKDLISKMYRYVETHKGADHE